MLQLLTSMSAVPNGTSRHPICYLTIRAFLIQLFGSILGLFWSQFFKHFDYVHVFTIAVRSKKLVVGYTRSYKMNKQFVCLPCT